MVADRCRFFSLAASPPPFTSMGPAVVSSAGALIEKAVTNIFYNLDDHENAGYENLLLLLLLLHPVDLAPDLLDVCFHVLDLIHDLIRETSNCDCGAKVL